VVLNNFSVHLV